MEIKKIAAHYRQYLARMIKQSTRADYTKRLEMLVCYASMQLFRAYMRNARLQKSSS